MIRALLVGLLGALLCCSPARAQTGQVISCPLVDTTTFNSAPSVVIGGSTWQLGSTVIANCMYTLPPTAMAYYFIQGTVTCGPNSSNMLSVIVGNIITYRNLGASFNGQITGSVLTVNSMITGPPFAIIPSSLPETTQRLYDAFSGSKIPIAAGDTTVWIVSQQTSTEPGGVFGGRGTYNLNTSVATPVAAETMWALPYRPRSIATKSNTYEQLACQNGSTVIESFGGSLPSGDQGPQGTIMWVQVEMRAESLGSGPQSASFTNGQIFIVMPSMLQGGLAQ